MTVVCPHARSSIVQAMSVLEGCSMRGSAGLLEQRKRAASGCSQPLELQMCVWATEIVAVEAAKQDKDETSLSVLAF